MTTRISTGIHRLAILLSVPALLYGLGLAIYGGFVSTGGSAIPDLAAEPELTVVAWGEPLLGG